MGKVRFAFVLCLTAACLTIPAACKKKPTASRLPAGASTDIKGELAVLHAGPKGDTASVRDLAEVVVVFDHPMAALAAEPFEDPEAVLKFDPPLEGRFRWMGTRTLAFIPKDRLPFGTEIEATIPAGTRSIDGYALKTDFRWAFATVRPRLIRNDPQDGDDQRRLETDVLLVFNQPVDPSKAASHLAFTGSTAGGPEQPVPYDLIPALEKRLKEEGLPFPSEQTLLLRPKAKLKPETAYAVEIKAGLPGREGPLGMEKNAVIRFETFKNFAFEGLEDQGKHDPREPLRFRFSNRVVYKDFAAKVKFEPPVEIPDYYAEWDHASENLWISIPLRPETAYTAVVPADLADDFGNRLGREAKVSFATGSYRPSIRMTTGQGVVEAYGDLTYPLQAVNVSKAGVRAVRLSKMEVVPLLVRGPLYASSEPFEARPGFTVIEKTLSFALPPNERQAVPIRLGEFVPSGKGFLFLELDTFSDARWGRYPKVFLQVTELGITGKFSRENNLLWISELRTGTPASNVEVELRSDANAVLWRGRTDADGLARAPGWKALGLRPISGWEKPRLWVIASRGDDAALLSSDWGTGVEPYRFDIPYDWNPEPETSAGTLFTERGIYRAGETVHIKGILRRRDAGRWVLPSVREVECEIRDPFGKSVHKAKSPLDAFGSLAFDFETREDAPLGSYDLTAVIPPEGPGRPETRLSESFRIEAFRPAEFEVHLRSLSPSYVFGATYEAEIKANYLFGGVMAGQRADWTLRLNPSGYRPPGHKGYVFGDEAAAFDEDIQAERSRLIGSGGGELGQDGKLALKIPLLAEKERSTVSADLEATVRSPSRRQISNRIQTIVHRGSFYIGLRPRTSFLKKGESLPVEVMAAAPDGRLVSDRRVSLSLVKREWRSVRKSGVGGRLEWISETEDTTIATQDFRTKGEPVTVEFLPEKSGLYVLSASAQDEGRNAIATTTYVYVTGADYVPWEREDDDVLELVADAETYAPGDKARILVKSPYERAKALVTVEREFILESRVLEIQGSTQEIEIPVTSDLIPNAFVSVLLLQGRTSHATSEQVEDVGKPSFKIGYLNLKVDPAEKRLTVDVVPAKAVFKPRDPVEIKIRVRDVRGAGAESSLTVAVVDVGVLNLIGYQTPDPFPSFYGERPLSVDTSETRLHVVGQRHYGEKGENIGGGGAEAARAMGLSEVVLRGDFKSTAYWNPSVLTDASGEADVRFVLPDNLTTFRIMVVAQTKDSLFGRGEASLKVAKPVLLLPALPRFARVGDAFQGGVLVTNHTDKPGKVSLSLQVEGLEADDKGIGREASLAPGESKEILWTFAAKTAGRARFAFRAAMGGDSDGLEITIPVEWPRPTETVGFFDETETAKEETIVLPGDVFPDAGGIDFQASASALNGLEASLAYLTDYPYLCLEQRLSSVLPYLVAPLIIRDLKLTTLSQDEVETMVRRQLREIYAHQKDGGGFSLWPDSAFESPFLTSYAAFAMLKAFEAGYPIDRGRLNAALDYLRVFLRSKYDPAASPYDRRGWATTQAFALYDLALAGRFEPAYGEKLFQERSQLSLFGRAMLLKALFQGQGSLGARETLVGEFLNAARVTASSAHFEEADESRLGWIYSSNTRTTAVILQALVETGNRNPLLPDAARWLVEKRRSGRWASTQENFFVFYALNEYYRVFEKGRPDFKAKAVLADKVLLEEAFRNIRQTARASVPLSAFQPGRPLPFRAEKTGPGMFYYGLRLTYAPARKLEARDEGFAVYKKTSALDGSPVAAVKAGSLVVVTLEVAVPKESLFVVVEDPLPAGFEAVNPGFRTESEERLRALWALDDEDWRPWWEGFNHVELHDNRVLLFADSLRPGLHTYRYLARALTFGDFSAPGVKVEQMYAPEVFGRSAEQV
ncbi:MAG: hypothetical protein FJY82_01030, partial [Candidatus Aminicenantes bacterium]|nr:hypothetical protein [Candidatus Aminicenantes bacterium]